MANGEADRNAMIVALMAAARMERSLRWRALAVTRRAWTHYWTRRAARATVGILSALDDRALKDIGFDRSEIDSVVYGDGSERRRAFGCQAWH
ncbi:MAG TPA: DUF1127 domain-containing protein [Hyphomicrobiaceae bacterium]|nr:DUF1127 domain-containing protein [Hyphomicrobiaceae bacterium]